MGNKIQVVIADDHKLFIEGLQSILEKNEEVEEDTPLLRLKTFCLLKSKWGADSSSMEGFINCSKIKF